MYIGICGPSGAGKDTVAEILAEERGYVHVSGGDILREMLTSLGLEPKKTALGPFAVFIRENYGTEPLFKRVLQKAGGSDGVIVTGIRSPDEARLIKHYGGMIIYVDAEASIRYKRIISRSRSNDIGSLDDFLLTEHQENSGTKGTEQNVDAIRELADVNIVNNGSIADLAQQIKVIGQ